MKVEHLDEVANKPNETNDAFYHHLALMQVIALGTNKENISNLSMLQNIALMNTDNSPSKDTSRLDEWKKGKI